MDIIFGDYTLLVGFIIVFSVILYFVFKYFIDKSTHSQIETCEQRIINKVEKLCSQLSPNKIIAQDSDNTSIDLNSISSEQKQHKHDKKAKSVAKVNKSFEELI